MEPRSTVITLGVADLERATAFYRDGLGVPTQGIVGGEYEYGAVAFFQLQSGVRLASGPVAASRMMRGSKQRHLAERNRPSDTTSAAGSMSMR
jgi:hypothetical protein